MKYALINGKKTEATKGAKGLCRYCGSELIAKCGEIKINHWAHKGKRHCDPWWENETEWHRSWKNQFPAAWQEVRHEAEDGEVHIADVKTESGWVIEFQHSFLNPEERRKRNAFYRKIVWVVDGLRRSTDIKQFQKMLDESRLVYKAPLILQVRFPEDCRLLREWHDESAFVFIDFKEVQASEQVPLWFLFLKVEDSGTYIGQFSRTEFIKLLSNNNEFGELLKNIIKSIHEILVKNERTIRSQRQNQLKQQALYSQALRYRSSRQPRSYRRKSSASKQWINKRQKPRRSKQRTSKRRGRGRF